MIKKNIFRMLFACVLTTLMLTACYEDKGNYDYTSLTEVKSINGINESYNISKGETFLDITPIIRTDNNGDPFVAENYRYEWRAKLEKKNDATGLAYSVISRDKNLVNFDPPLNTGTHKIYLVVFDNRNDVFWQSEDVTLVITQPDSYGKGLMFLTKSPTYDPGDTHQGTNLELWSIKKNVYTRTYVNLNVLPEGSMADPIGIHCYTDYFAPNIGAATDLRYAVTLLSQKGGFKLRHDNMNYLPAFNLSAVITGAPEDYVIDNIVDGGQSALFFTSEGNMLKYNVSSANRFLPNWNFPDNRIASGGELIDLSISPRKVKVISSSSVWMAAYDDYGKKFYNMAGTANSTAPLVPMVRDAASTVNFPFDLSSTQKEVLQFINTLSTGQNTMAVVRDYAVNPNTVELWEFNTSNGEQVGLTDVSNSTEILNATRFGKTAGKAVYNLYYATPTKVYTINTAVGSTDPAKLLREAPAGYEIVYFDVLDGVYDHTFAIIYAATPLGIATGWKAEFVSPDDDNNGDFKPIEINSEPLIIEDTETIFIDFDAKGK